MPVYLKLIYIHLFSPYLYCIKFTKIKCKFYYSNINASVLFWLQQWCGVVCLHCSCRYHWSLRPHHPFSGWNDLCGQRDGETGNDNSTANWRSHHIKVRVQKNINNGWIIRMQSHWTKLPLAMPKRDFTSPQVPLSLIIFFFVSVHIIPKHQPTGLPEGRCRTPSVFWVQLSVGQPGCIFFYNET